MGYLSQHFSCRGWKRLWHLISPPMLKAPTRPTKNKFWFSGKGIYGGKSCWCILAYYGHHASVPGRLAEGDWWGREGRPNDIKYLCRAIDLLLCATKERAQAIGRSMAPLVGTERYLWLNLSCIKEKDQTFVLDAPLSPSGLFGNAVSLIVKRFQEAKRQSAAFWEVHPSPLSVLWAASLQLLIRSRTERECCCSRDWTP